MTDKMKKTEEEWREELTPEQYHILREKGTEAPFTGKYWNEHATGMYHCAACGQPLFESDAKFDSGCGWPSFTSPVDQSNVETEMDTSHGMIRREVLCSKCGGHLGHVFDDGPAEAGGLRYCINSVSVDLDPEKQGEE